MWAANALLGTLAYLGLVGHGQVGSGASPATPSACLGKAVFGAPDLAPPPAPADPKFLTVKTPPTMSHPGRPARGGAAGPDEVTNRGGRFSIGRDNGQVENLPPRPNPGVTARAVTVRAR